MSKLILPRREFIKGAAAMAAYASLTEAEAYYPYPAPMRMAKRPPCSTFLPTDLSNLVAWWDASDSGTITQSGGAISQWNDKSGNSHTATQSTGSKQPTVATAYRNGLDAIYFNSANSQEFDISTITIAAPWTCFSVMRRDGNLVSVGTTSAYSALCYYDGVGGSIYWSGANTLPRTSGGVTMDGNGSIIMTQVTNGSTAAFERNGVSASFSQPGATTYNTMDKLGSSPGWGIYSKGWIYEIFFYSDAKNSTDIASATTYLKCKWGIT